MTNNSSRLALLASLPQLPPAAVATLLSQRDVGCLTTLAANPTTPQETLRSLAVSRVPAVRRAALERVDDIDLLRKASSGTRDEQIGAAANPRTPAGDLDRLVRSPSIFVSRTAMANAAAPTGTVVAAASQRPVSQLFSKGSDAYRAVGVGRVLTAHAAVVRVWANDPDSTARRALARWPEIDADSVRTLLAARGRAGRSALAANPYVPMDLLPGTESVRSIRRNLTAALRGADPRQACADVRRQPELAAVGSPTLDLLITGSADVNPTAIDVLLGRGTPHPEPDILVGLAERFGPVLARRFSAAFGCTRVRAAALHSRVLQLVDTVPDYPDDPAGLVGDLAGVLGDMEGPWRVFAGVCRDHPELELHDAAVVAAGVAQPAA